MPLTAMPQSGPKEKQRLRCQGPHIDTTNFCLAAPQNVDSSIGRNRNIPRGEPCSNLPPLFPGGESTAAHHFREKFNSGALDRVNFIEFDVNRKLFEGSIERLLGASRFGRAFGRKFTFNDKVTEHGVRSRSAVIVQFAAERVVPWPRTQKPKRRPLAELSIGFCCVEIGLKVRKW